MSNFLRVADMLARVRKPFLVQLNQSIEMILVHSYVGSTAVDDEIARLQEALNLLKDKPQAFDNYSKLELKTSKEVIELVIDRLQHMACSSFAFPQGLQIVP